MHNNKLKIYPHVLLKARRRMKCEILSSCGVNSPKERCTRYIRNLVKTTNDQPSYPTIAFDRMDVSSLSNNAWRSICWSTNDGGSVSNHGTSISPWSTITMIVHCIRMFQYKCHKIAADAVMVPHIPLRRRLAKSSNWPIVTSSSG